MLIDTEAEKQAGIGKDYKFEPMKYGECAINEVMAESLDVE